MSVSGHGNVLSIVLIFCGLAHLSENNVIFFVQVGETGCGKTALVQRLAEGTGRQLVVQNLSLQTDGADLLGGFRPVELRQLAQVRLRVHFKLC